MSPFLSMFATFLQQKAKNVEWGTLILFLQIFIYSKSTTETLEKGVKYT